MKTKKLIPFGIAVVTAMTITSAFSQAVVSWTTGNFTDNTVLSLAGSPSQLTYAINLGGGELTTDNGYTFQAGDQNPPNPNVTGDTFNIPNTFFSSPATTGDLAFDSILGAATFWNLPGTPPNPQTYTLNNLIDGQTYNVLFLMADTRSGSAGRSFSITSGATSSPTQTYAYLTGTPFAGGYALGTFTASGTTQVFGKPGEGNLNGIVVAVPEPSTVALVTVALGSVLLVTRRSRRAV